MLEEQIEVVCDGCEAMDLFRDAHDIIPLEVEGYG